MARKMRKPSEVLKVRVQEERVVKNITLTMSLEEARDVASVLGRHNSRGGEFDTYAVFWALTEALTGRGV